MPCTNRVSLGVSLGIARRSLYDGPSAAASSASKSPGPDATVSALDGVSLGPGTSDDAARLGDEQRAGGVVPRLQPALEVAVEAPRGDEREVEGCRADAPQIARERHHSRDAREVAGVRRRVVAEAGREQGARRRGLGVDGEARVVEPRAAALRGVEQLAVRRAEHGAGERVPLVRARLALDGGDADGVGGDAVGVVDGAVDRIDDPGDAGRAALGARTPRRGTRRPAARSASRARMSASTSRSASVTMSAIADLVAAIATPSLRRRARELAGLARDVDRRVSRRSSA